MQPDPTTEITFDDTACLYEAWIVSPDGAREWVGAFDTNADARAAVAKAR